MLPAPTTIATSTPRSRTAATWLAMRSTSAPSVPYSRLAHQGLAGELQQDAPESGLGRVGHVAVTLFVADAEIGEAGDADVLAGLRRQLLAQLLDRLRVVFLGVDVRWSSSATSLAHFLS